MSEELNIFRKVQEGGDTIEKRMQHISIEELAKKINVPSKLIEQAVLNDLAIPVDKKKPYFFSKNEVEKLMDYGSIGRLIQSRLKRDKKNEYSGKYIEPGDYIPKNEYILPFKDCWLVTDGGKERTAEGYMRSCHYYIAPCVRWAWDFDIIYPDDYKKCHIGMSAAEVFKLRLRRGQKEDVPDYEMPRWWEKKEYFKVLNPDANDYLKHYFYGVDIIAPADGVIMTRSGSIDDSSFVAAIEAAREAHDDRQMSFMIDHGSDEFSQIAHIIARTLAAKPGEKVKQSQFLCKAGGKCPHMPHLHWAIMDSWHPLFAQGLPVAISECLVYRDDKFVKEKNVWLERGLLVRNAVG